MQQEQLHRLKSELFVKQRLENKHNLEVRQQLAERQRQKEKFEDERNDMIRQQLVKRQDFIDHSRKQWNDQCALDNMELAMEHKRKQQEKELEERRIYMSQIRSKDPHAILAQDHYNRILKSSQPYIDEYLQGQQAFDTAQARSQSQQASDYYKGKAAFVKFLLKSRTAHCQR